MQSNLSNKHPTLTNCTIHQVLAHPTLIKLFRNHCMKEFCVENLYFLEQEQLFQKLQTKEDLIKRALEMYNEFFTPDSPYEINLTEKKIAPIRNIILKKQQDITKDLFKVIKFEVEYLFVDCFDRFKCSTEFQKFFIPDATKTNKIRRTNSFLNFPNMKKVRNNSGKNLLHIIAILSAKKEQDQDSTTTHSVPRSRNSSFSSQSSKKSFSFKKLSFSQLPRVLEIDEEETL
eukprot:gene9798-2123_t